MQTEEISDLVRQRGTFNSAEEARKATAEVLTVLASRDLGGEAKNLAAQLPPEFGDLLRQEGQQAETFGADEFLKRLQDKLNQTEEDAEKTARAVLSSVTDAVNPDERASFVNALPQDLSGYARWS